MLCPAAPLLHDRPPSADRRPHRFGDDELFVGVRTMRIRQALLGEHDRRFHDGTTSDSAGPDCRILAMRKYAGWPGLPTDLSQPRYRLPSKAAARAP